MNILILNGPNLNRTGKRSPEIYGHTTMEEVIVDIQRAYPDVWFHYFQSNHEGDLIDQLQAAITNHTDGVILNAGGYSHTSIALRDAVQDTVESGICVVEVHISDITQREPFRRKSLLTEVCTHAIIGHGTNGYQEATEYIIHTHHQS